MAQHNKTCSKCGELGHSKFYCKNVPPKPLKRSYIKRKPIEFTSDGKIKKPRKKTITRSQLVKKLDKVFSEWLRRSYADEDGNVSCYTCGEVMNWKYIQNGHFFTRGRQNTRWLSENCRPQDYRCNVALKGNYIIYTRKMLAELGEQRFDDMEKLSKSKDKIPTVQLVEMIKRYTELIKEQAYDKR